MSKFFKKSFFSSIIIVSAFLLLFSCSVGLGESVDTEVPKVEITYPPASRAVRDWFYLAGTCSDDKGVDSISVSAENISTNETIVIGTVSPAKDGSWSVKINEKDSDGNYKLKDGTYTFSAVAKDSSKQNSAPNYRTIEIDNTAPVFVIKNPGTTNSSAPASFGSILKVVGAAADDHEIYELSLSVYSSADMSGEPKAVLSEKNVDKTDGINVTLARYNPDVEQGLVMADELHNNYVKIYNVEGGGDQQFYASVTLKDSAEVWQNPGKSQADSIGNSTEGALYLNDSIYDTLMGKNSKYKLTAADFMRLLNGTFKNSSSASSENRTASSSGSVIDENTQTEILNILSRNLTETQEKPVAFKLNKNANPSYEIMGFAFKSDAISTFGSHKAAKQSSLTFKASAGRDGTSVKPTSLKVYLFGPYDSCTAETLEKIRTEPESFYNAARAEAEEAAKKVMGGGDPSEELVAGLSTARIIKDYSGSGESSTETFTESIELPNTITKGKFYAVAASGEDIDGLPLATQNYYGFIGESAGTPPSVSITGFEDGAMLNALEKVVISGTVVSEETEIARVTYTISVWDGIKSKSVGKIAGDAALSFGGNKLSAGWKIADIQKGSVSLEEGYSSCVPEDGERFKYTVTVSGKDSTGLETKDTKSFEIDKKVPEIKINDITPVAKKETYAAGNVSYVVNGKIKFSAVVTDTNLSSVVASVSDSAGKTKELYSGGNSTIDAEVDTTEFADGGKLVFSVTAKDSAGNTAVSERNDVFVSQKTDFPAVNFTNGTLASDGISDWSEIANGKNVFGIENNNSANFSLTDDDGIDSVLVSVYDEKENLIGSEGAVSIESAQLQKQENSENAKEAAANPVTYKANGATSYSVSYMLPKLAGKYKIQIEVSDTEYFGAGDANKKWHKAVSEGYILVSEGNISISFVDITNNTCKVRAGTDHTVEGTVSLSSIEKLKSLKRFAGVKKTSGESGDGWEKAPAASASYPFATEETDVTKKITVKADNGKLKWTDTLSGASIADGEQHFFYKATGVDGNSAEIELICNGDGYAPKIISKTDFEKWYTSTSVKLSVLAADVDGFDPSGISKVTYSYKKDETDFSGELARGNKKYTADGTEDNNSGKYYEYSTTVDFSEGETSGVVIKAEDNVGNSRDVGPFTVKVDTAAPAKTELSIPENLFKKNTDSVLVSYAFSDAVSGLSKIEFCTNRNFNAGDKTYKPVDISDGAKTYGTAETPATIEIPLTELKDGEYKIYARATDVAGNVSGIEETGTFTVDSTAPKVEIKTPVSGATVNKTISFAGMVTDNNLPDGSVPVLQYKDGTEWKAVSDVSTSLTNQEWTITGVDTTELNNTASAKDFKFRVVFTDEAGNTNNSDTGITLTVNQNADRPEIKLTNISITGSSLGSNVVQGVISDDDGVSTKDGVKLYRIDAVDYDAAPATNKTPSTGGNKWKSIPVEAGTGIWKATIDEGEEEGPKNWYFCVIDEAGGEFCTKASSLLERPYLTDGSSEEPDNETGVSFFYDLTAPTVKISLSEDGTNYSTTNTIFGGSKKLYVRAEVEEAVKMAEKTETKAPAVLYIGGIKQENTPSVSKNGNIYTYTFEPIALSGQPDNAPLSISVTAEDSAGNTNKDILNITIDKKAPTVKIISPTATLSDAVSSAVSVKGIVQDDKSSIAKLDYVIPKKSVSDDAQEWKAMGTAASWDITFASGAPDSSDSLLYYAVAKNASDYVYQIEESGTENIYKVPIWFRVSDSVGNKQIVKDQYVLVDSEGGKPKAWINSPENDAVTSGVVTIYGGASDNVSVKMVLVQIDANNDGNFNAADATYIKDSWSTESDELKTNIVGSDANWYIPASGTNSWKLNVDTSCIPGINASKKLRIRVKAIDDDGNEREWSDYITVTIDSQTPVIKNLKLVQYGKGVTPTDSTPTVTEREYVSGMYISDISAQNNGQWYLTGEVSDNESLSEISFTKIESSTSVNIDIGVSDITTGLGNPHTLRVPLKTDSSGVISYAIKAKDNSTGEAIVSITINIDSTSPSLYNTSNTETLKPEDKLRLKSMSKTLGTGEENSTVVNNNNFFTFGDVVSEAGSGLEYIAFYFERARSDGGKRIYNIYNPMFNSGNKNVIDAESFTAGKVYINGDGLAALCVENDTRLSEDSITLSAENANIRKGGLIKIAGGYSLITEVSGKTVKFSPTASTSFTKAELILAQIVDHKITESVGSDGSVVNDDGDEMIETINQIGSSYNWTASVDSNNIPDGPITIHVVAIDNAGNTTHGSVATKVENNRPRIAKVLLGTDLNGNGKYDWNASSAPVTKGDSEKDTKDGKSFGEFSYFTALDSNSGKAQSVVTLNSGSFKVLGKLCIIPEFVGGNNGLGYILEYPSVLSNARCKTGSVSSMNSKTYIGNTVNNTGTYEIANEISSFGGIELTSLTSGNISITFWDKTEETVQGTNSQWALLKIPVNLMTDETESPVPVINPFYWKDSTDNSVYIDGEIKGHIELEKDLTEEIKSALGTDPKVSGKIKIEGTVYDNVRIYSISASVFGGTSSVVSSYNAGIWTQASSLPECVESFTAEDMDMSQNGHTVKYTMIVDTEKLSDSAGLEKTIIITAKDWQGNTSEASSAQTVAGTITVNDVSYSTGTKNYYKMDVVPYVTEIVTNLSSYSLDNPSVYARSSVGSYPVYEGEEIEIKGYNLGQGIASVTINEKTVTLDSSNKMTVDSSVSSGTVSVSVNNISAVNNLNKNDAIGSYSGSASDNDYANCYNRQPNGVNNNLLTDDLSLDVWNFKTAASPIGSSANYVHMKVGPYLSGGSTNSGRIGFSFKNAIGYFNMPGQKSGSVISSTGKVDLYIADSCGKAYGRMWDQGGSEYYYGDSNHKPTSLGTKNSSGYYVISLPSVNFSSGHKLGIILSEKEGDWDNQTGNMYVEAPGKYYIGVSPNSSLPVKDNSSTLIASETYTNSVSTSTVYSQTRFGTNYGGFNHNTFAFDKNGYTYGAAQCPDTSGQSGMSANFQFFSRAVSDESSDYHGLNFNYYNATNARRIENTSYYKASTSTVYTDENRVQNPEMATYINGSTSYVYLAYYDHGLDMIKFRVGSVGSDANGIGLGLQDLDGSTSYRKTGKTGTITDSNGGEGGDSDKIAYSNRNLRDSLDSDYAGNNYVTKIAESGASPYVAVGALPTDGTAVVVWYDKNVQALKMKSAAFSSVTSDSVSWTDHGTISTVGGKYVSMATDEAGGIHFAYLSNSGANLYYTYMSSVSATPVTMLVDAYQDVGDRCMITVGRESISKPWIPYISYKSNYASHTKIAYPVFASDASSSTLPSAGIVDGTEKYTGAWNVSLVPDTNLSIDDTVSVGVNKDWASNSGVMYDFPTGTTQTASDIGVYALCNATIVYGNGTKNPVMGYAIEDGTIQMAQKK